MCLTELFELVKVIIIINIKMRKRHHHSVFILKKYKKRKANKKLILILKIINRNFVHSFVFNLYLSRFPINSHYSKIIIGYI